MTKPLLPVPTMCSAGTSLLSVCRNAIVIEFMVDEVAVDVLIREVDRFAVNSYWYTRREDYSECFQKGAFKKVLSAFESCQEATIVICMRRSCQFPTIEIFIIRLASPKIPCGNHPHTILTTST